jgi:hypothetical protein
MDKEKIKVLIAEIEAKLAEIKAELEKETAV